MITPQEYTRNEIHQVVPLKPDIENNIVVMTNKLKVYDERLSKLEDKLDDKLTCSSCVFNCEGFSEPRSGIENPRSSIDVTDRRSVKSTEDVKLLEGVCLWTLVIMLSIRVFIPLKIYNGTPEGRPTRDSRATLPINEWKGNPPMADCPISNLHRCK